ncbi:GIY-YIG nuclease family protein [Halorubrum sp. 48-1-W]|nr:GIY-YIG nuclease family protein [Halorubrum sp. 48-1-W]
MGGGTYTLLVELPTATTLSVGALGEHLFPAGAYAYTGSALGPGGFSRVRRHRRTAHSDHDVRHWHVDYLLGETTARIDRVVHAPGVDAECAVARRLPAGPVDGFGASDCGCSSHLSTAGTLDGLIERVVRAYDAEATAVTVDPEG